ncbi:replication initiation protein [Enterococcus wangshanyuanii]|uniref:RepB family plasmid replication initiator protein n=1 Tax=Enterococcus wangshanyuanii TaxID=2005703 RepID=A0ABQ1PX46_9ENTE|nr:replication initiation protein [Enterococcus wangshanyuanii]GGD05939.1 RepB family plasmid replication initiator protein [Enterococcus wangshanyuanii]
MEKKDNLAVKYQNELNLIPLKNFNAKEMDLFFSLCAKMKNRGLDTIRFSFEELKELSDYKITSISSFIGDLERLYKNMLNLSYREESENKIKYFVLFNGFEIDKDQQYVEVSVNPNLERIINGLTTEFSRFELSAFTAIRSTYTKTLFRLLMQFHKTGIYIVKIDKFKKLLDIPKSYRMSNIDQTILKPSLKELQHYFNDLELTKIKAKKGNKIERLEFTFSGVKNNKPSITLHDWVNGE